MGGGNRNSVSEKGIKGFIITRVKGGKALKIVNSAIWQCCTTQNRTMCDNRSIKEEEERIELV